MRVSDLEYTDVVNYLHIDAEDVTTAEQAMIEGYLEAAKTYVAGYTGLTESELDEHPDIAIAALCIAGDMFTNRDLMTGGTKSTINVNRTVETILNMHSVNLLPEGGEEG